MRFIFLSRPFKLGMPIWLEILWVPVWAMLVPFMAVLVPIASYYLNQYEKDTRFTIGYHISAKKITES